MASTKKTTAKTAQAKPAPQKRVTKSGGAPKTVAAIGSEELVADNIAAVSQIVGALGMTLEVLVQKIESMAHHIIATEEILAELVSAHGLNLAYVNARIRAKIAAGTGNSGNPDLAIDVAASIASPLPRR